MDKQTVTILALAGAAAVAVYFVARNRAAQPLLTAPAPTPAPVVVQPAPAQVQPAPAKPSTLDKITSVATLGLSLWAGASALWK